MSDVAFRPLEGVRVLEFGQIVTVPFCGMLLADLGADVVKVENADGGDGMRQWPPLMRERRGGEGFSGNFASLNRNKRSIAANLKDPARVARVARTVRAWPTSSSRTSVRASWSGSGLGYETLRAQQPRARLLLGHRASGRRARTPRRARST